MGLMKCGRAEWQEAEAIRKDISIVLTDSSGEEILYLRALQGHSGRHPIDPTLQDNVLIPDNVFDYIYHIGCAINSITNSGLIAGGQNSSSERQTVFLTAVNPMSKDHEDPHELDLTTPRLAWYKQKKWTRHQDTVYWVDLQLAQQKGFKFHQTRSNSIILYETLPAYCVPKVVVMEPGENIYQKVYVSPRLPPKISFQDNWMKDLDSEVAGSSKDSQRIHSKSKTQLPRTVRPVSEQPSGSFTQAIGKDVLFGRESTNSRTERPVDGLPSSQPELCASVC